MLSKKLRVLVAEGTPADPTCSLAEALQKAEQPIDLTVVSSVSGLLPSVKLVDPEIIFLDLNLAQPDPAEAVRRLHRATPGVPIIVVVNGDNHTCAAKCLAEGATDYLSKEILDEDHIKRVLRVALERNTLAGLTDLLRDPLTGFHNRDAFLAQGARTLDTARLNAGSVVLLCAHLGNFSSIRRDFGTGAADRAIQQVGEALTKSFRQTDMLARIGDAQFAALATDAAEPSVEILRQRIEKRLEAYDQSWGRSRGLELRISANHWTPQQTGSFAEFLDSVESGLRHETRPVFEPMVAPRAQ